MVVAGCGGAAPDRGAGGGGTTPTAAALDTIVVEGPAIPAAPFDVAPGELLDADIYNRVRHRVRLARQGVAYLRLDGPRVDDTGMASKIDTRPMYPVLAESPDRIRIVDQEDHARLALWIERSDTAESVLAPVQLSDATGHAPVAVGVWLGAGASVDADQRKAAPGFREVTLRSPWIHATGYVREAELGNVWIVGEREGYEPSTAEDDGKSPVATGTTVAATTLRATPHDDGAVLAEIVKPTPVRVLETYVAANGSTVHRSGPWTEVEIHIPRVRARGFVATTAISAGDKLDDHRVGHERAFGSTSRQIHVPTGTCLYDQASGEVAGVNLGDSERYLHELPPLPKTPGWWPVIVSTTWGNVTAYVHDTASAAEPKGAVLESCTAKKK